VPAELFRQDRGYIVAGGRKNRCRFRGRFSSSLSFIGHADRGTTRSRARSAA
jgi:hypothetical protein